MDSKSLRINENKKNEIMKRFRKSRFRKNVKKSDINYAKSTTEKRVIVFYQENHPKKAKGT